MAVRKPRIGIVWVFNEPIVKQSFIASFYTKITKATLLQWGQIRTFLQRARFQQNLFPYIWNNPRTHHYNIKCITQFHFYNVFLVLFSPLEFPTVLIWFCDIFFLTSHHVLLVLLQSGNLFFSFIYVTILEEMQVCQHTNIFVSLSSWIVCKYVTNLHICVVIN